MKKKMTCIECPKGCSLIVDVENCIVKEVEGNLCPKGKAYAAQEIQDPRRMFTTTLVAEGLSMKLVPVRTDKPIPKHKLFEAIRETKKLRVCKPVFVGDIIVKNFCFLDVDLIATREVL